LSKPKIYVLCVSKEDEHIFNYVLVPCCKCGREVWVSLHNLDKNCVCIHCVTEAIEKGNGLRIRK
jgi:hypothetical protein